MVTELRTKLTRTEKIVKSFPKKLGLLWVVDLTVLLIEFDNLQLS